MNTKQFYLLIAFISMGLLYSCSSEPGFHKAKTIKERGFKTLKVSTYEGNDLKRLNSISIHQYDKEGRETSNISYGRDNQKLNHEEREYNSKGKITKLKRLQPGPNPFFAIIETQYEKDVYPVVESVLDSTGKCWYKTVFWKEGDYWVGQRVSMIDSSRENKTAKKFDKDGNLLEVITYDQENNVSSREIYKYNAAGKQTESKMLDQSGKPTAVYTTKYDAYGNWIESVGTYYQNNKTYTSGTKMTYNEHNDFITMVSDYPEQPKREYRYELEYNDRGDCIRRVCSEKEKPISVEVFEIKYY